MWRRAEWWLRLLGGLAPLDRGPQTTGVALQVGRDGPGMTALAVMPSPAHRFEAPTASSAGALLDWPYATIGSYGVK